MQLFPQSESARALRDAVVGERIEVQEIVFETLRLLFPPLGVATGETLRCVAQTPSRIVLRREDGRRIEIDPFYACFIGIRHVPELEPWHDSRLDA